METYNEETMIKQQDAIKYAEEHPEYDVKCSVVYEGNDHCFPHTFAAYRVTASGLTILYEKYAWDKDAINAAGTKGAYIAVFDRIQFFWFFN